MTASSDTSHAERRSLYVALALIGAAQGTAYYLIDHVWQQHRELAVALATFTTAAGFCAQLSWMAGRWVRLLPICIALGCLYGVLGWAAADSLAISAKDLDVSVDSALIHLAAAVVGLAILIPFVQVYMHDGAVRWNYEGLFLASWGNPLSLGIAGAMLGVSWLLLWLWAYLFKIIGIETVHTLITERSFVYIFSMTVVAIGVAVARDNAKVTAAIRAILLGGCWLLVPPMALFAIVFLLNLPFAGFAPLSRHASVAIVVLALASAMILLINGVYQYGERVPPLWFRIFANAAIATVPFLAAIGWHAASMRIEQYGLSDDRFVLVIVVVMVAAYGASYLAAAALDVFSTRQGEARWLGDMPRINVAMAIIVVVVATLINTPVLDPVLWSVRNQVARLEQGRVRSTAFDYGYLQFKAGRRGRDALDHLATLSSHPEAAAIAAEIAAVRRARDYWTWQGPRRHTGPAP